MQLKVLAVCAVAVFCQTVAEAGPVFTGDFTSVAVGTYSADQVIGNFRVVSGTVDVVGPTFAQDLCLSESHCLDLNGDRTGAIESIAIDLQPSVYELMFSLNGSHRGYWADGVYHGYASNTGVSVGLGALFSESISLSSDSVNIFRRTFEVSEPTSVKILFSSQTDGWVGSVLNNVTLTQLQADPASVPEPASVVLIGAGGCLLLAIGRWRRRQS